MATPLSALRLGQIEDREPWIVRIFDSLLDACRSAVTPELFETAVRLATRAGHVSLPIAAVLGFVLAMTIAIRLDAFSIFLYGLGWVLALLVLQYLAARFAAAAEESVQSSPSFLASDAFLRSFALLNVLAGWLALFVYLFQGIQRESMPRFLLGLGLFLACECLACIAIHPDLTNVAIRPQAAVGEEALGLLWFFLKALLRLVPIAFGAGVALGTVGLAVNLFNLLAQGTLPYIAWSSGVESADLIVRAGLLPFVGLTAFLILSLVLHVIRAVLAVPGKLDLISRELAEKAGGGRPAAAAAPRSLAAEQ